MFTRRAVLATAATLPLAAYAADSPETRLAALEKDSGGRIGVAAFDTGSEKKLRYRADERFLMCSTVKLLLVAATLKRIQDGTESAHRHVMYTQADVLEWAPITKQHVADGMDVADIAAAAIEHSDNTAANLLYALLGGPAGLQHYARDTLGDWITSVDRNEPSLNVPASDRDTTMPGAMLGNMHAILLGDALLSPARQQITDWMMANTTGDNALRAGLPPAWQIGDKTGNGSGAHNDLAIAIPRGRGPILISAYTFGCHDGDAALAGIGRIVAETFG